MNTPKISSPTAGVLQRLAQLTPAQFALAVIAVAIALLLNRMLAGVVDDEVPLVLLALAIAAAAAVGGLLPGIVATGLACLGSYVLSRSLHRQHNLLPWELRLVAGSGLILSLLGWALGRARERARRTDADNRELERQILEIGDEERQRIGHDLHDGLGQHLTGISLLTESLNQQAAAGVPPRPDDVENITRLVSDAVGRTRDLARSLSPLTLEHEGFVAAMEELAENAGQLLRIQCQWDYGGGELPIAPKRALHLYRIVQEAISNSVKHGKAKRVRISLQVEGSRLTLRVSDDGSGLSRKTTMNPGLGLRIMQYRARMVGAVLTAERSSPVGGTVVTCSCQLDDGRSRQPPPGG